MPGENRSNIKLLMKCFYSLKRKAKVKSPCKTDNKELNVMKIT